LFSRRCACAQGKHTNAKKSDTARKSVSLKAKRAVSGDQQKLRNGANMQIKPKIAKRQAEYRANAHLTTKITQRIEQTMAARAGTGNGGLQLLKVEEGAGSTAMKTLKAGAAALAKAYQK